MTTQQPPRGQVQRLRHRGKALLIAGPKPSSPLRSDGARVYCSCPLQRWYWTQLLDAAAQAAGLYARDVNPELENLSVVAAYDDLDVDRDPFGGTVEFAVTLRRRVMGIVQLEASGRLVEGDRRVVFVNVALAPQRLSDPSARGNTGHG